MHPLVIPIFLLIAGLYVLVRNFNLARDSAELKSYLATSPKGKLWVNKFGLDRTVELSKKYFLPLGIAIAVAMIGVSIWSLYRMLPHYL